VPRYTYRCEDCETTLDVVHLMKEKLSECSECGSASIKKIPSQLASKIVRKTKVGDVVKQGIKENARILDQQIKEFRKDYTEEK